MDISLKSIILFGTVVLTGLSAGFFFAWSVSVILGTEKVSDSSYMETMQSINRAILNPAFFIVFFGSMVSLSIASIYQYNAGKLTFILMLLAAVIYLIGTIGVTGLGNVPLNDKLDALNLEELSESKMSEFRNYYESNWNRLHSIRTLCAVAAFLLSLASVFTYIKDYK